MYTCAYMHKQKSSEFSHLYFEIIVELQEIAFKNMQGGPVYLPVTQLSRGAGG